MAKLKAPNGCTGCSFNGEQYPVKRGYVVVPDEAVAELIPHGFITEVDEEAIAAAADDAESAAAEAANQGGAAQ
jgi:hypothetical protein